MRIEAPEVSDLFETSDRIVNFVLTDQSGAVINLADNSRGNRYVLLSLMYDGHGRGTLIEFSVAELWADSHRQNLDMKKPRTMAGLIHSRSPS